MSVIVRDDIQSRKCLYVFPDRTDDFFWDRFIVNDLACGTFCNTCAVKGEHVSAESIHLKFFCKRRNTVDRPPAGKNDSAAGFLNLKKRLFCRRGNFLF